MNQADSLVEEITSSKEFQAPANKESIMKDYETKIVSIEKQKLLSWNQTKSKNADKSCAVSP